MYQQQRINHTALIGQSPHPLHRLTANIPQNMPLNKENNWPNKTTLKVGEPSKKPLISPVKNQHKNQERPTLTLHHDNERNNNESLSHQNHGQKYCPNHPSKSVEFEIEIEGEILYYCNKCGAQLASKGFEVTKISANEQQTRMKRMPAVPVCPEYEGNPMYEMVAQFLRELSSVQNQHTSSMQKLDRIEHNYQEQLKHTTKFYQQLLTFIEQMRDDHLADLHEEGKKHSQIADIEHDYLRENMEEMSQIRKDIEDNLDVIMERLEEDDLRENLNEYRQKIQVKRQRVEDQEELFQKVIVFQVEEYHNKLARVQEFMMEVWDTDNDRKPVDHHLHPNHADRVNHGHKNDMFDYEEEESSEDDEQHQQHQHQHQHQQQPAFRQLFDQNEAGRKKSGTSPQFKKF